MPAGASCREIRSANGASGANALFLPPPIWKTSCEPIKPATPSQPFWPEPCFVGLRRVFFPSGAEEWLLRGQAS